MKKIPALILAFVVLLGGWTLVSCAASGSQTVYDRSDRESSGEALTDEFSDAPDISEIMGSQALAQAAYTEFLTSLPTDPDGCYVYPSTFAGAYMDEETRQLCIALTDCSAAVQADYNKLFSDPSIILYREVSYSYNDLLAIQETIQSEYDSITVIGIDQQKNVVTAGLSDLSAVQKGNESYLRSGLPVELHYAEPITLNAAS